MSSKARGKRKAQVDDDQPAKVQQQKKDKVARWDVRGKWEVACKEADNYSSSGPYTLFINGDGQDVLYGEFDLGFLTGHIKCNAAYVTAEQTKVDLIFGSREQGEGELSDLAESTIGPAATGWLAFSKSGKKLTGVLSSTFGSLALEGDFEESRAPPVVELQRKLKHYTSRRHDREGRARWDRWNAGGPVYDEDSDEDVDGEASAEES